MILLNIGSRCPIILFVITPTKKSRIAVMDYDNAFNNIALIPIAITFEYELVNIFLSE